MGDNTNFMLIDKLSNTAFAVIFISSPFTPSQRGIDAYKPYDQRKTNNKQRELYPIVFMRQMNGLRLGVNMQLFVNTTDMGAYGLRTDK